MTTVTITTAKRSDKIVDVSGQSLYTKTEVVNMLDKANWVTEDLKTRGVCGRTNHKLTGKKKTMDSYECLCGWRATVSDSAGRRQTLDSRIRLHDKVCRYGDSKRPTNVYINHMTASSHGVRKMDISVTEE